MDSPIRVYADTSVFGGIFDVKFADASAEFFLQVEGGKFELVVSPLVESELRGAPQIVRDAFQEIQEGSRIIEQSEEADQLQQAYIDSGILTEKSLADAMHVALATVARCRLIVSWNFRHIVHFQKIPLYNAINRENGYGEIAIHSPLEVVTND